MDKQCILLFNLEDLLTLDLHSVLNFMFFRILLLGLDHSSMAAGMLVSPICWSTSPTLVPSSVLAFLCGPFLKVIIPQIYLHIPTMAI